jgi:parallel beta-helix repeat protein
VNGGGVSVQGNNVVLLRVTGQNNGQLGIGGRVSEDSLVIDCVSQGNNTKGFSPAWEAGSGKFTDTDGAYILNFTAKNNNGFGLWFDYENTNYVIEGGTFTGNHYGPASWEGVGIMLEISDGPGRVENADIYGNSGSGIMVGESQNITIQNNTLTNNDLELRDLTRPPCHIYNVDIRNNVFHDTRISTTQGTWNASSIATKEIAINGNTYDDPAGSSLMYWGTLGSLNSISAIQADLNLEQTGLAA